MENQQFQIQTEKEQGPCRDLQQETLDELNQSDIHQQYQQQNQNKTVKQIWVCQKLVKTFQNLLQCFLIERMTNSRMMIFDQKQSNSNGYKVYFLSQALRSYQQAIKQYTSSFIGIESQQDSKKKVSLKKVSQKSLIVDRNRIFMRLRIFLNLVGVFYLVRVHLMQKLIIENMKNEIIEAGQFYGMKTVCLGEDDYLCEFREEICEYKFSLRRENSSSGYINIISQELLYSLARIRHKKLRQILKGQFFYKAKIQRFVVYNFNEPELIYSAAFEQIIFAIELIKIIYFYGEGDCLLWNQQDNDSLNLYSTGLTLELLEIQKKATQSQSSILQVGISDEQSSQQYSRYCMQGKDAGGDVQKLNQVIQGLRKESIISLKDHWDRGLLDDLSRLALNEQIYGSLVHETLSLLVQTVEFRMVQFTFNLRTKAKQEVLFCRSQKNSINLIQKVCPGIQVFVRKYLDVNKLKNFWSKFDKQKEKINKLLQRKDIPNLTVNNSIPTFDDQNSFQAKNKKCLQLYVAQLKKKLHLIDNNQDQMIIKYAQQLVMGKVSGNFAIKLQGNITKSLEKQIFNDCFLSKMATLQNLLVVIKFAFDGMVSLSTQKEQQKNRRSEYLNNIENERLCETRCLGCSRFFYQNMNILDDVVNQCPVKVFPSIKKIRQEQTRLKRQISAMLNGNGGVILFGCSTQNRSVIVRGEIISQTMKDAFAQSLEYMIQGFYPRVSFKINVGITFVPVKYDPYKHNGGKIIEYTGDQGLLKGDETYIQRKFMPGMYVARIRVSPPNFYSTYFWRGNQQSYFCSISSENKTKQIESYRLRSYLKKKFKHFWKYSSESAEMNGQFGTFMKMNLDCFDGECLQPQLGSTVSQADIVNQNISDTEENVFKYMSLLIIKTSNIPILKKILGQMNIKVQIEQRFKKYDLKSIKGTAIIHHNIAFQELLKLFLNEEFKFDNKRLIAIYITQFLHFIHPQQFHRFIQSQINIENAKTWLNRQFPGEIIRYYQYDTLEGKKYYLATDSKLSTVFAYYMFNHFDKRLVFKTPHELNNLFPSEKAQRLRQIR